MTEFDDVRRQRISFDQQEEVYAGVSWWERIVFGISLIVAVLSAYFFTLLWFSLK